MNPYDPNYKWNGKWNESEQWLMNKGKVDVKDDSSQWLLENSRPKFMVPEPVNEQLQRGYDPYGRPTMSPNYTSQASVGNAVFGPYFPDGGMYKQPMSPSPVQPMSPIPVPIPMPPPPPPLTPMVPSMPSMGLDSLNSQISELRNQVSALQKTILEQQRQLVEQQEKTRQMEEEVQRASMTKVVEKQVSPVTPAKTDPFEDFSWANLDKFMESFAKHKVLIEMMQSNKELAVIKDPKVSENIVKKEEVQETKEPTTKNKTKNENETKVAVEASKSFFKNREKTSQTLIKNNLSGEKLKVPMSPPGRKEAKQVSIKKQAPKKEIVKEIKKRSQNKKVHRKYEDESKESLHKRNRSIQSFQKRKDKKSLNKKDELDKHLEDQLKKIDKVSPVTLQKIPSDAPTALIAPDDYEHIFSAQKKNAHFVAQQPTKDKMLPTIPSDAPTALIAPDDYEHIYTAPKKEPAKPPALPQIPSDAPTALIAPDDYEHIYSAPKKELAKEQPKAPLAHIPSDAPTALIAPDDYVHIFHAPKKDASKPLEPNASKGKLTVKQHKK